MIDINTSSDLSPNFYSGLSGLQLPIPKYMYPPSFEKASRLTYYSTYFNSIEFNSSFYKIPQVSTVTKWTESVTETFRFTFKLWQGITHNKGLIFDKADVTLFFHAIHNAKNKNGCVLIQFPPKLGVEHFNQLENLLSTIKELSSPNKWRIAVEFRNISWYHKDVYKLLNAYNVSIVIQDIPKSATPSLLHKSEFIYIRFHGPTGNYRGSYSDDLLNEYATYIQEWIAEGKTVYVYFNNTMGDAFNNLQTLNNFISAKLTAA